jgi:segregation and condensation protein B
MSEDRFQLIRLLEAMLFAAAAPLPASALGKRLPEGANVDELLAELQGLYANRGVNLVRHEDLWCFRTASDLADRLAIETTVTRKLSRAAIETLAIVSYHQPVTRAEIEEIRGVALSQGTLDKLLEVGWIKPKGRRQTPGRPVTWVTTDAFLSHFGLESLEALPGVEELKAAGLLDARPAISTLGAGVMAAMQGGGSVDSEDDEENDGEEETANGADPFELPGERDAGNENDGEADEESSDEGEDAGEEDDDAGDDDDADDDDGDEDDEDGASDEDEDDDLDEEEGGEDDDDADEDDEDADEEDEDGAEPGRQRRTEPAAGRGCGGSAFSRAEPAGGFGRSDGALHRSGRRRSKRHHPGAGQGPSDSPDPRIAGAVFRAFLGAWFRLSPTPSKSLYLCRKHLHLEGRQGLRCGGRGFLR